VDLDALNVIQIGEIKRESNYLKSKYITSNTKWTIFRVALITLACHPIVIGVLSPYMLGYIGLTWEQYILWLWSGLLIGLILNGALVIYIPFISPYIDKLVDRLRK